MARTVGQRWRARRDLVILVAHRRGVSLRLLAHVFDLSKTRVGEIVADMESRVETGLVRIPGAPEVSAPKPTPGR